MDYNKSGKFGLIIKKKEDNNKKVKSFVDNFKDDDDEDDEEYLNRDDKSNKFDYKKEINKNIQKQGQYNMIRQSEEMSKNLLQDPNFYEYDAVYDDMSNSQKNKKRDITRDNVNDKPKYLGSILAASEKRKIEQSIVKERVERIKREREIGEYGDKPKFVTRAYEEKIKIDKKREIVAKLDEKYNEKNTVNSEFGMMGFYSNLLTKNVAYGGVNKSDENEEVISTYKDKIKQYENFIENDKEQKDIKKLKEDKEKEKEREREKEKEKEKEDKENIIEKDILAEKEKQEEGIKNDIKEKVDLEEYKKRYLERKRNRPME